MVKKRTSPDISSHPSESLPPTTDSTTSKVDAGSITSADIVTVITIKSQDQEVPAPFRYSNLGEPNVKGGRYWERGSIIKNMNMVAEALAGEGIFMRPLEKRCKKMWEKGFTIVTPGHADSKLPDEVNAFFDKYDLWLKTYQATMNMSAFGEGLLWYQLKDIESPAQLERPMPNGKYDLNGIKVISKLNIVDTRKDKGNNITHYGVKLTVNGADQTVYIHASRMIPFINDPFGTHPDGLSELLGSIEHLDALRNIRWTMHQLLLRRGAPPTIVYYPKGLAKSVIDDVLKSFKQLGPNDVVGIPLSPDMQGQQNTQIRAEWNPNFSAIGNLSPIIEFATNIYCASIDYPKALLFGINAGSVTGSETNIIQWLSGISADQRMKLTHPLMQLINNAREHGQIESQDVYSIAWNPLPDISAQDMNKMHLNTSSTGMNLISMGYEPILNGIGLIDYNATKKSEISVGGTQAEKPNPRAANIQNPGTEAPAMTKEQVMSKISELQDEIVAMTDKESKMLQLIDSLQLQLTQVTEHQEAV